MQRPQSRGARTAILSAAVGLSFLLMTGAARGEGPAVHPALADLPQPAGDENPRHHFQKLTDPAAEFNVPPLAQDELLKLTGRVKCLRVSSMDGSAMLDASELDADEIIVTGPIDGGTSLRLSAPQGRVALTGIVAGGTKVEIQAGDGVVVLGTDAQNSIFGGAHLNITTRELNLQGAASGGAEIAVNFTKGGSLRFAQLNEGAHVVFQKQNASDPDPRIEAGTITGGASVRSGANEPILFEVRQPQRRPESQEQILQPPSTPARAAGNGPTIPRGLILRDGSRLAGEVVSIDESKVTYRPAAGGEPKSVVIDSVAVVLFRPYLETMVDVLQTDSSGVMLRSGDFMEGSTTTVQHGRVTLSSDVFGLKTFNTDSEAVVLVLHRPPAALKGEKPAPTQ